MRFRQYLRALGVGLIFLAGLFAASTAFPLARLFGVRTANRIRGCITLHWHASLLRILHVKVRRIGQPMASPGLFVSNHISWLDILVLGAQAPVEFIAKEDVAEWPAVGYLARQIGTLFVRRGDPESTRRTAEDMVWRLRRGQPLVLFPEGTSSTGAEVLQFHARLFQPAILANVPIQAVAIAYRGDARPWVPFVGDDDFVPHLWRLLTTSSVEVDLVFCAPIFPGSLDRSALARQTRVQIVAARQYDPLTPARRA